MVKSHSLFLMIGLLAFIVYGSTLAPTITWRPGGVDSGDLATAVAVGGVPHPPGYPTYLVLGQLFKQLPWGDVAYRLNWLSAACAALTVAVWGWFICQSLAAGAVTPQEQRLRRFCAASAALTLAFAGPFWSQAVIAEVYALNALFVAGLLYMARQVGPANQGWLGPALFALLGLSLGNHLSILLVVPWLIWMLRVKWHWPFIASLWLTLGLGLSIYLIIPLRAAAAPPLNWGLATSWPNFWWLVSGQAYRSLLFALPWEFVPARLAATLGWLAEALLGWGLPVSLLGLTALLRAQRVLGYGSLLTFGLIASYAVGYNTTDSVVYLLPGLLLVTLWLGWGLLELSQAVRRYLGPRLYLDRVIGGVLLSLPLLSLGLNFSEQNMSQDQEAIVYAQQSLQLVAAEAVILTADDPHTFALWYGRYGLALRPDVAIVNIHLLSYDWYQQSLRQTHARLRIPQPAGPASSLLPAFIEQNLGQLPIYLASQPPPGLAGYRLEAVDSLHRVVEANR